MNDKIKQLTSNYLANFNNLDSASQQKIIQINSESEWIIFNASSLKAQKLVTTGYVPMLYVNENDELWDSGREEEVGGSGYRHIRDYIDKYREELEVVGDYELGEREEHREPDRHSPSGDRLVGYRKKVYGYLRKHDGTVNTVRQHLRASRDGLGRKEKDAGISPETYDITDSLLKEIGKEVLKIYYPTNDPDSLDCDIFNFVGGEGGSSRFKTAAIPTEYYGDNGKGNKDYWIAVNKSEMPKNGYEHDETTVCLNRAHWKKENKWNLSNLLTDNEIINSRERETEIPLPNNNSTEQNSSNNQSQTPLTTQNIQFKIKSTWRDDLEPEVNFFSIVLESPITVNEKQINLIEITGKKANTAYQNGDLQTGNTIVITNVIFSPFTATINGYKELSISKHYEEIQVVSSAPPSPDSPPPPEFFPEVRQKNQELPDQEREMVALAEELLKIVEKNQEFCQEIKKFGLRPLEISNDALLYFQEEFFTELNEQLALDSSINREISNYNETVKQKKLSIKKGIYRILNNNKQTLLEEENKEHNPKPDEIPDKELKETRQQVREEINKLLNRNSSLQNIELNMLLTNGKYQKWEEEIEQLSTKEEILTYRNTFLKTLKKVGIGEKKNNISNASTLKAAQNIAEERIREALKKNNVKPESLRKLWVGSKTWQGYLKKLKDKKQIEQFVQTLEREISHLQMNDENPLTEAKNTPYIILLTISALSFLAIIGLVITRIIRKKNTTTKKRY